MLPQLCVTPTSNAPTQQFCLHTAQKYLEGIVLKNQNDFNGLNLPDAEEARIGSMLAFLKAQPVKYLRQFILWFIGISFFIIALSFAAGQWVSGLKFENEVTQLKSDLNNRNAVSAGEQAAKIAQVNADWESRFARETSTLRQTNNELNTRNSSLMSKIESLESAIASANTAVSRKESDLASAQNTIINLQSSLASNEKVNRETANFHRQKIQDALRCNELRAEADRIATQGGRVAGEWRHMQPEMANIQREAETKVAQAHLTAIQQMMGACGR